MYKKSSMILRVIEPFHLQLSVSPVDIYMLILWFHSPSIMTRTWSLDLSCGNLGFKLCVQMTCGGP